MSNNEDPFVNGLMEPSEFKVHGSSLLHLTLGDTDTDDRTQIPTGKLRVHFKIPSLVKIGGMDENEIWELSRGGTYLKNVRPIRFWELQEVFLIIQGRKVGSGEIVATIGYNSPTSALKYGDLIKANDTARIEFTVTAV